MTITTTVRPTTRADLPTLAKIADATELFPGEMLADMAEPALVDADSPDIWLTCEHNGQPIGFCYTVPEQLAEGAWNMLAIAVHPGHQNSGAGSALTAHLEDHLRKAGARLLLADTSSTEGFAPTRAFYAARGYEPEATIRNFWADGDDKVTFVKAL